MNIPSNGDNVPTQPNAFTDKDILGEIILNRNNYENIKIYFDHYLSLGAFNSCLVDDTTSYDLNDQGPNLAGFTRSQLLAVICFADGNEYDFNIPVRIVGPTSMDLTNDIIVTFDVDATSTH